MVKVSHSHFYRFLFLSFTSVRRQGWLPVLKDRVFCVLYITSSAQFNTNEFFSKFISNVLNFCTRIRSLSLWSSLWICVEIAHYKHDTIFSWKFLNQFRSPWSIFCPWKKSGSAGHTSPTKRGSPGYTSPTKSGSSGYTFTTKSGSPGYTSPTKSGSSGYTFTTKPYFRQTSPENGSPQKMVTCVYMIMNGEEQPPPLFKKKTKTKAKKVIWSRLVYQTGLNHENSEQLSFEISCWIISDCMASRVWPTFYLNTDHDP